MVKGQISSRWRIVATLLVVLCASAFLRFWQTPDLPRGFHYDEAANGILSAEIASGQKTPIFIPSYTGKEVLFFYWTAFLMRIVGTGPLALRLSPALIGLATIPATFWAFRELLHNQRHADWIAVFGATLVGSSFWHLVLSRYGFRAVTQPLLQAVTVALLWRGLRAADGRQAHRAHVPWLISAGIAFGLTAYTYLAARAFPLPIAAGLLAVVITDSHRRRARVGQIALFLLFACLAVAPLGWYWVTHPGSFLTRAGQVMAPSLIDAMGGLVSCLGMFFVRGDPYVRFNVPGMPLFGPITATLFIVGIAGISRAIRGQYTDGSPANDPLKVGALTFLLAVLPTMILPSALATGEITPSHLRSAGLLPFAYVFPALGLSVTLTFLRKRLIPTACLGMDPETAFTAASLILLAASAGFTWHSYFVKWAPSAELYYATDGDLTDISNYLNGTDVGELIPYIASVHYRHPTVAFLAKDFSSVRWLTGGQTLVFPATQDALAHIPRSTPSDWAVTLDLLSTDSQVHTILGPDGSTAVEVYRLPPASHRLPKRTADADFGHVARLLGYDVLGTPRSGETLDLAVWWRVTGTADHGGFGPSIRLTDPWGSGWGGALPFHYPSEQWTPGELVVDHLQVEVDPGTPPGMYDAKFGFYSGGADVSLPVLNSAGHYSGTAVSLPVEIGRAVAPPSVSQLGVRTQFSTSVGSLILLGANVDSATLRPGEPLYVTLFWSSASVLPDYEVTLLLGETVLHRGAPIHNTYPTSRWGFGEVVVDRYDAPISRTFPAGQYGLSVSVATDADERTVIDIGAITVDELERQYTAPPVNRAVDAALGNRVVLLGYDLVSDTVVRGGKLALVLHWRSLTAMDQSYTVFVQVVDSNGNMLAQTDHTPVNGSYPTTLWTEGEVVADAYRLDVPVDAPTGISKLIVGMYAAQTGVRLPVAGTTDAALLLQDIAIQ
jgi:hypothetical protein